MSKLQESNVANERVYTVEEIAKVARISRTGAYELIKKGYFPVIVCSEEARILVKRSTEREMPDLVVLSLQEIDKEIKYEVLGEVKVG